MPNIGELWKSGDVKQWRDALAHYWDSSSVQNNLEVERFMDKLDREDVRKLDTEQWRVFLRIYFIWKFNNMYLKQRLADLESNEPDRLFRIKDLLFSLDPNDVRRAVERARYIKGLGAAEQ